MKGNHKLFIQKFNKNHDPHTGEFISGSAMGGVAERNRRLSDILGNHGNPVQGAGLSGGYGGSATFSDHAAARQAFSDLDQVYRESGFILTSNREMSGVGSAARTYQSPATGDRASLMLIPTFPKGHRGGQGAQGTFTLSTRITTSEHDRTAFPVGVLDEPAAAYPKRAS